MRKLDCICIVDDDEIFADSLADFFQYRNLVADVYYHPTHFLRNLSQYDKDTKICIDHDFKTTINGIELAKQLNEAGYTKLYLLSGRNFCEGEIPDYLEVLLKGDMDNIEKTLK